MRIRGAAAALAAAAMLTTGCGGADGRRARAEEGSRLPVVATTMQLQDFVRQVGGRRVHVTGLLDREADPHEYEPAPSALDAVSRARVVVAHGAGLDGWMDDLLANAGGEATRVTATDGIDLLPTQQRGFPGDPHVWHDPERARQMVDNVAAGLSAADPAGRELYARNAAAYVRKLARMARAIRREFAPVPPVERTLVTSHDAFGYFARAYDLRIVGSVLPAVTTEAEPSARHVRELVKAIRAEGVTTIFTEEAVAPRLERQVAQEAGARVSTSLYADVLGPPGSGAETFIGSELANARAMRAAWSAR
jgi:ABC-type Zn uptake system ZnuABC Zn-binding protein ZnuA